MEKNEKIEDKEKMVGYIKYGSELMANLCLELDGNNLIDKQEYDGEDLFNSSLLFMHILGNLTISNLIKKGLNVEQASEISEELGSNLKKIIESGTGINMEMLTKRMMNK